MGIRHGIRYGGGQKREAVSKSEKAGLMLPIPRVAHRIVQRKTTKRAGQGASVYLTGVLEYVAAEILDLSIDRCKAEGRGRKRITEADVIHVLRNDRQLNKLLDGLRVLSGNKLPRELISTETTILQQRMAKKLAVGVTE